ncbi:PepSY domain-containing protein [Nioella sp.]|uniref:PepSY domain-containing protein n=1 Tax=Nioella sp. TaxID=1912091 RepID=UPI003A846958
MKKTLSAFALIALLPAGAALADDDECHAPRDQWQPREAAMQLAEQNGWTVREFEIDDGCYEIEGRDQDGREIEVQLDPATLEIVEMEYEDEDDDRRSAQNPAPAGAVAPPLNGLFENGTPPQVQVN